MQNEPFNFKVAKERIDLVDYLDTLGHRFTKQNSHTYWYLSPLRDEKTASFKVDRGKQVWYDHGTGKGGDLVGFAREYFHCGYKEVLRKFREFLNIREGISPNTLAVSKVHGASMESHGEDKDKHIRIVAERPLRKHYLQQYVESRGISFSLAGRFLKEVDYTLYGKTYTALGFQNDAGGYELRNRYFKGSSMPKAPTILLLTGEQKPLPEQKLAVFEGFFSMLSFLMLQEEGRLFAENPDHILVLNSLAFLNKTQDILMAYGHTDLYLDGDTAGQKATELALSWKENKTDRRYLYEGSKDLNAFIMDKKKEREIPEKSFGMRR